MLPVCSRLLALGAVTLALCGAGPPTAHAQSEPAAPPWGEVWAGAEATPDAWAVYSGTTIAPFGGLHAPGFRLRAVGGYGRYGYDGNRLVGGKVVVPTAFRGTVSFTEALVGWQVGLGSLTSKAFVGYAYETRLVSPHDPVTRLTGAASGVKLALENWVDLGPRWWGALDGSWSSVHSSYWTRARIGWRAIGRLSVGLEAGAVGNREYDAMRAGLLLRYEWSGGEVSGSFGTSGDYQRPTSPYASVNLLTKF